MPLERTPWVKTVISRNLLRIVLGFGADTNTICCIVEVSMPGWHLGSGLCITWQAR